MFHDSFEGQFYGVFGWKEFGRKERERKESERKWVIFLYLVVEENTREILNSVEKVVGPSNFFFP